MQNVYSYIAKWSKDRDAFAKLQGAYGVLAVALLLVAALVGLMNASLGQAIVFYAFVAALTFVGNGVMWAVLKTFVVPAVEKHAPKTTTRKK